MIHRTQAEQTAIRAYDLTPRETAVRCLRTAGKFGNGSPPRDEEVGPHGEWSSEYPGTTRPGVAWPEIYTKAMEVEFARLADAWKELEVAMTTPAAHDSAYELEKRDRFAMMPDDVGGAALSVALDNLETWHQLFLPGFRPSYAQFSILRTAHESSHMARWLLEPGLESQGRAERGLAAQLADLDERRKYEDAASRTQPTLPAKSASDRIVDLLAEADARNLTKPNKRGASVLKTVVPSVEPFNSMEPVAPHAEGSLVYRVLSGYAHGAQWTAVLGAEPIVPSTRTVGRWRRLSRSQ